LGIVSPLTGARRARGAVAHIRVDLLIGFVSFVPAKPEVATRNRPSHDPKTALETVTEKRAAFGRRSR
jgi:hypothetical protein